GCRITSPSPPCPPTATAGTPLTVPAWPLATSTSRSAPPFSVTSARPSGRKVIAQGWLNEATVLRTKGGSGSTIRRRGPGPPVARSTSAMAAGARAGMRGGEGVPADADSTAGTGACTGRDTITRDEASATAGACPAAASAGVPSTTSSQPESSNKAQARLAWDRRIRGSGRGGAGRRTPCHAGPPHPVTPVALRGRESRAAGGGMADQAHPRASASVGRALFLADPKTVPVGIFQAKLRHPVERRIQVGDIQPVRACLPMELHHILRIEIEDGDPRDPRVQVDRLVEHKLAAAAAQPGPAPLVVPGVNDEAELFVEDDA